MIVIISIALQLAFIKLVPFVFFWRIAWGAALALIVLLAAIRFLSNAYVALLGDESIIAYYGIGLAASSLVGGLFLATRVQTITGKQLGFPFGSLIALLTYAAREAFLLTAG